MCIVRVFMDKRKALSNKAFVLRSTQEPVVLTRLDNVLSDEHGERPDERCLTIYGITEHSQRNCNSEVFLLTEVLKVRPFLWKQILEIVALKWPKTLWVTVFHQLQFLLGRLATLRKEIEKPLEHTCPYLEVELVTRH